MFFSSWLRNRKPLCRGTHRPAPRRPIGRFRPGLEVLEDRAVPATLHVTTPIDVIDPNDGLLSLREAVIQANASQAANTIVVPAGTYKLALAGFDDTGGDLDLTGRVTIKGAGAGATIFDGARLDRVFEVIGGANATLSDMTIQGGRASSGGGIFTWGTLAVQACVISDNFAVSGDFGGGICNLGTLTITDSVISDNVNFAGKGGGIYNNGTLTLNHCILSGNSASQGGGILNDYGTLTVHNSTFSGNSGEGGGILNYGKASVVHSSFSGNTGGILNFGHLTVYASTFCDNGGFDLYGLPPDNVGGNTFC